MRVNFSHLSQQPLIWILLSLLFIKVGLWPKFVSLNALTSRCNIVEARVYSAESRSTLVFKQLRADVDQWLAVLGLTPSVNAQNGQIEVLFFNENMAILLEDVLSSLKDVPLPIRQISLDLHRHTLLVLIGTLDAA